MRKKAIIITSIIISIILIGMISFSMYLNKRNRDLIDSGSDIVIYRYEVDGFKIIPNGKWEVVDRIPFTMEAEYDKVIYSYQSTESKQQYNRVIIKDGVVRVTEANCFNLICMHTQISLHQRSGCSYGGYIVNSIIQCQPHGIVIQVEERLK